MKLSIGSVIYNLRKSKGITQERLANAIGVSTGAVSKWENGNTYPDITLLSPIARFLGTTVDSLLEFESSLSKDEIINIYKKCCDKFISYSFEEAMDYYKEYVKQYPNNLHLKFRLGGMLQQYMVYSGNEENMKMMINESIGLIKDCTESEDLEIREGSLALISSLYMMIDEHDKAIESIEKIQKQILDPKMMLSSIYYIMGDIEKSKKIDQESLYCKINELQNVLISLSKTARNEGDFDYALELASIHKNIIEIFKMPYLMYQTNYIIFADIYAKMKDEDMTLYYLEKIVDSKNNICQSVDISKIKFFDKLTPSKTVHSKEYLAKSVSMIIEDESYDFIKHLEHYKLLIEKDMNFNMKYQDIYKQNI